MDQAIQAAEAKSKGDLDQYVVISTVHRLKGLERKIMYGSGWCEGETSYGKFVGLLPHTFSLSAPPQQSVLNFGYDGRLEDERCIAYVCITRAKEIVRLSGFEQWRNNYMEPSRFITEMGIVDWFESEVLEEVSEVVDNVS